MSTIQKATELYFFTHNDMPSTLLKTLESAANCADYIAQDRDRIVIYRLVLYGGEPKRLEFIRCYVHRKVSYLQEWQE